MTKTRYVVGSILSGQLYLFDGIGAFASPCAAIAAYNSAPRNRSHGDLVVSTGSLTGREFFSILDGRRLDTRGVELLIA